MNLIRSRRAALALAGALVIGGLIFQPWSWCGPSFGATRIEMQNKSGAVFLDRRAYQIGVDALLDYGLKILINPLDYVAYRIRGAYHPMTVFANISASSREILGQPVFTCVTVKSEAGSWSRRPHTGGTHTLADGYPPGAAPPEPNEAWRQGVAGDGPEWPAGEIVSIEVTADLNGRLYTFVFPPFPLSKGL